MEISADKVFKYKLCGWLLLMLNMAMLFTVLLTSREFTVMAINYSFFTLMHLTALMCAAFALKDNNAAMLYPILVSLIFFIAIPLSMWVMCTSNVLYCSILIYKGIHIWFFDCGEEAKLPLAYNFLLLGVVFEKLFEFILFRRLMKIFERQRCNEHFQATQIKNAFSTNCDTDDEIVVFEKTSQYGQPKIYDYGTQRPSA